MVDLLPNEEQSTLLASITDYLSNEMPLERLRPPAGAASIPPQTDRWQQFAELGWFGIALSDAHGGVGFTLAEEALAFREFGRYLVTPAVLAASIAARIAASAGDGGLCEALVSGRKRVGLACPVGSTDEHYLLDAATADLLLELTETGGRLYAHEAAREVRELHAFDATLPLAAARLDGAPLLQADDPAIANAARVLIAAMLVGSAEATRDMAVEYVKIREQFGRPIGSFQAIKHKCADLAVRAEAAWSQTVLAALRANQADAAFHAAAAGIVAARAATDNAEENIQIHGGIGFTVECDAHLYLKRSHLLERVIGGLRACHNSLLATIA